MPSFTDNTAQNLNINTSKVGLLVLNVISNYQSPMTIADIQVETGLSLFDTQDALSRITKKYICSLEVNPKGDIFYDFGDLILRNPNKVQSFFFSTLKLIKSVIVFVIKLLITLVFFSYAFTIGTILSLAASGLSKNPQLTISFITSVFEAIKMLFTDIKSFFSNEISSQVEEKNLVKMIFAYAFGLVKQEDELKREKEIATYIRLSGGIISTADLMLITAWSYTKCNQELTYLLTHFEGSPEVSEEGVIIYNFPKLTTNQAVWHQNKTRQDFFTWNNLIKPLPFNHNPPKMNQVIDLVVWLSLIVSFLVFFSLSKNYNILYDDYLDIICFGLVSKLGLLASDAKWIYLSFYLFLFFVFFLLSSIISRIPVRTANKIRKILNEKKKLLQLVFSELPILRETQLAHISEQEQFLFVNSCRGETKINEQNAKIEYDFSFIHLELKVAEQYRGHNYGYQFSAIQTHELLKLRQKPTKKYGLVYMVLVILLATSGYLGDKYLFKGKITAPFKNAISSHIKTRTEFVIDLKNIKYDTDFEENLKQIIHRGKKRIIFINGSVGDKLPSKIKLYSKITFRDCTFPLEIPEKTSVNDLEFINCKIDSFPKFQIRYIETLRIDNCGISKLPFEVEDTERLKKISLTHNQLISFPIQLLRCQRVKEIDLSNNMIKELPNTISPKVNFVELNISNNQIKELPESFWEYELQKINISRNPIKKFPSFVQMDKNNFRSLRSIVAANCELKEMPEFWKLPYAADFDFSNNSIAKFPSSFCISNSSFSELLLQNNKFTEIPSCLTQNSNLNLLNISYNPLIDFPLEFENRKKNIRVIINKDMNQVIKAKIIKTLSKSNVFYSENQ